MLIGMALSAALYGVTCLQTFMYFRTPHQDKAHIPTLVLILLGLDTFQQALTIHILWTYVINTWGFNFGGLAANSWSLPASLVINVIIACIVNSYLLWRLYRLSESKSYCGLIGILLIGHLGLNLAFTIRLCLNDTFLAKSLLSAAAPQPQIQLVNGHHRRAQPGVTALVPQPYFHLAVSGLAVDCAIDFLLAIGLVYYLYKSRSGLKRTEDLITKLIVLTISTGLLTSAAALAEMIALNLTTIYAGGVYVAMGFIIGKLYINAFLTSLNTRGGLASSLRNQGAIMSLTSRQESGFSTRHRHSKILEISARPIGHSNGTSGVAENNFEFDCMPVKNGYAV